MAELAATRGAGSVERRGGILAALMGRATAAEQVFLRSLLSGEVRQGALDAVALEGVAAAAGVRPPTCAGR